LHQPKKTSDSDLNPWWEELRNRGENNTWRGAMGRAIVCWRLESTSLSWDDGKGSKGEASTRKEGGNAEPKDKTKKSRAIPFGKKQRP